MNFHDFDVNVIQCCFVIFYHDLIECLEHDAQHDLSVREMTLCVTYFARLCLAPSDHLDRSLVVSSAKVAQGFRHGSARTPFGRPTSSGCPPDLTSARPRLHPELRSGIPSVGGSAMHMKRPDGIGREAGIGRTRHRDGLQVFQACPC